MTKDVSSDAVDTVLLDVDGTLVDSTYLHALAWMRAFAAHDLIPQWWQVHRAIGMGGDRLITAVAGAEVEERLKRDKEHKIKAILAVQIDTASGAVNDIEAIGRAIKAAGHPALFMVDTVASLGCMPFEMDKWYVDVAMSGSQKGLMTPPGLGFVAASDRAWDAHKKANLRTPYWDWTPRAKAAELWQFWGGTPPVQHIYGLTEALAMLLDDEGLEAAWRRHEGLAAATWPAPTIGCTTLTASKITSVCPGSLSSAPAPTGSTTLVIPGATCTGIPAISPVISWW